MKCTDGTFMLGESKAGKSLGLDKKQHGETHTTSTSVVQDS